MSYGRRKRVMLVVVALLAIGAGVVLGLVIARLPSRNAAAAPTPAQSPQATGLAAELNLTVARSEGMKRIWQSVRDDLRDGFTKAETLQRRRDEEIAKLLNDEQRPAFEKLTKRYAKEYDDIQRRRHETFDRAVAETRRLLNDEQRRRYDDMLKSRVRSGDALGFPGGGGTDATTVTTTQQSRGTP
jgi:hypothetical protein